MREKMDGQALKSALKKCQEDLILAGALITSITLSGIGLFGSGKTSFAFGVTSIVLLVPFSLFATVVMAASIDDIRKKGISKDSAEGAFFGIAVIGGTILTGVSLFSKSADNTIIGLVGFALLASSLLLFTTDVAKNIKHNYYNKLQNSSLRNVNSKNSFKNEVKTI